MKPANLLAAWSEDLQKPPQMREREKMKKKERNERRRRGRNWKRIMIKK